MTSQGLGYYVTAGKAQGLGLESTVLVTMLTGPRLWHATRASGQHLLASEADVRLAFMERAAVERADVAITGACISTSHVSPPSTLSLLPAFRSPTRFFCVPSHRQPLPRTRAE
jgi:hypothetical protein